MCGTTSEVILTLTLQHIEESLSLAYVSAVSGRAGVNISVRRHDYGIDGTFHQIQIIKDKREETGIALDWQLKATQNWIERDDTIVYDLDANTYNRLARRQTTIRASPCILILFCLPENPKKWLDVNYERLLLRKCCYWQQIIGEETENTNTRRVFIPKENLLTVNSVSNLLELVDTGEIQ
jgi:hypothetical protein